MRSRSGSSVGHLRSGLQDCYLVPDLKSRRTFPTVVHCFQPMAAWTEVVADRPEGRQKALGLASGLKALHRPLAFAGGLMGVFGAIVEVTALPMFHTRQQLTLGRTITGQIVGDDHSRHVGAALQQLAEERLGGRFVAAALDQDVEHVAVLIDGPPAVVSFAIDREKHFIEVPCVAGLRTPAAQLVRIGLAEFVTPLTDRFLRYKDATSEEEFFDIAKAERKAMVQPDGVGDDFLREAKTLVGHGGSCLIHAPSIAYSG